MKKPKKTVEQKLAERKYHRPNRFIYFLYHLLAKIFILHKYHPVITIKDDINKCKGPCVIIWNHLSRIDHAYLVAATYPKRMNILAGYNEFFRSHLQFLFKITNILPKKNYAMDPVGIKAMLSIIKQGGCIAFSPEGMMPEHIKQVRRLIYNANGKIDRHYYKDHFLEVLEKGE